MPAFALHTSTHVFFRPDMVALRSDRYLPQCAWPASMTLPPLALSSITPSLSQTQTPTQRNRGLPYSTLANSSAVSCRVC